MRSSYNHHLLADALQHILGVNHQTGRFNRDVTSSGFFGAHVILSNVIQSSGMGEA